jgi:hypothetical protein
MPTPSCDQQQPAPEATARSFAAAPQQPPSALASATVPQQVLVAVAASDLVASPQQLLRLGASATPPGPTGLISDSVVMTFSSSSD